MRSFIVLIVSFFLFLVAPVSFSSTFVGLCAIVFLIGCVDVFVYDIRNLNLGIFNFNILFLLSSFVTIFVFPLFIYSTGARGYERLLVYNDSTVNKCVALSTMAMCIYFFIYLKTAKHYKPLSQLKPESIYNISNSTIKSLNIWSILLVLVFTINILFYIRRTSADETNLDVNTYVVELTFCFLEMNLLLSTLKNKHKVKNNVRSFIVCNRIPLLLLLTVLMEYLYISDRGAVISIILYICFIYNAFCKKIKTHTLVIGVVVGVIFMSLIAQLRKTDSSFRSGGVNSFVTASDEIIRSNELGALDFLSDLTIVSCVSYIGYDIKEQQGLYNPERILMVIANPIPLGPTLISYMLYGTLSPHDASTSRRITNFYHEANRDPGNGGIGTSMMVDIYMSWGFWGVVIAFSLFAFFTGRANTLYRNDIINLIIIFSFIGLAVYMPRSTLYICYRGIIWNIVLIKLLNVREVKQI